MCGIVGVIGRSPAAPLLLDALKRLEYRGYDSAGVATVDDDGALHRSRAAGKLRNLELRAEASPLAGGTGVGHTRWATHGAPTEANAHPHKAGGVVVVHNGIIENFRALRQKVEAAGGVMASDTDTETVAHLLDQRLSAGASIEDAMIGVVGELEGAFALAIAFEGHAGVLAAARRGSPLAVGTGEDIVMIGSDALALSPFCDNIIYLDEGDIAILREGTVAVFDASGAPVERQEQPIPVQVSLAEKGNYRHFMLKEIHEQTDVIAHNLGHYLDMAGGTVRGSSVPVDFANFDRLTMSACGTAYYACLAGRYWFEAVAGLAVDLDVASELRYRHRPAGSRELALFVSQSGETADTLASMRAAKAAGQTVAAVVTVTTSTMAREADMVLPTLAGMEVGVASTKAFTCQLTTLAVMAIKAGLDRGALSAERAADLVEALAQLPGAVADALNLEDTVARVA
ncbi:MAG: glutamine--fructose-6-phosphate transaminase (isomerizing), partial [Pseudomonadota bacterium]